MQIAFDQVKLVCTLCGQCQVPGSHTIDTIFPLVSMAILFLPIMSGGLGLHTVYMYTQNECIHTSDRSSSVLRAPLSLKLCGFEREIQ